MRSHGAASFLTALAFAIGGCGDDDDGGSLAPATGDSAAAIEQDTQAKVGARILVSLVETCYVDSMDYTQCLDAAGSEDVGQATVDAPSPSEFVVTSPSESGNEFRVTKGAGGALERTCTEPGEGGCGADGSW